MDLRKIKKLIELVEESGIAELEVKSGEEAVRISMGTATAGASAASGLSRTAQLLPDAPNARVDQSAAAPVTAAGKPLKAPLSGTFYAAPAPDAAAFVQVGDVVSAGDVLCIVESMKMMNRIEAESAGTISALLVPNGEPVEAGQPLFLIS